MYKLEHLGVFFFYVSGCNALLSPNTFQRTATVFCNTDDNFSQLCLRGGASDARICLRHRAKGNVQYRLCCLLRPQTHLVRSQRIRGKAGCVCRSNRAVLTAMMRPCRLLVALMRMNDLRELLSLPHNSDITIRYGRRPTNPSRQVYVGSRIVMA